MLDIIVMKSKKPYPKPSLIGENETPTLFKSNYCNVNKKLLMLLKTKSKLYLHFTIVCNEFGLALSF